MRFSCRAAVAVVVAKINNNSKGKRVCSCECMRGREGEHVCESVCECVDECSN